MDRVHTYVAGTVSEYRAKLEGEALPDDGQLEDAEPATLWDLVETAAKRPPSIREAFAA